METMKNTTIDLSCVCYETPMFFAERKEDIEQAAAAQGVELRVTEVPNGCLVQLAGYKLNWWFYLNTALFVALWTAVVYILSSWW